MEPLAIPCLALATASGSVGVFYLFLYLRTREAREQVPFLLLCFNLAAYDLCCAGLYNARSLAEGVFWQRLQLISLCPVSILILWFYGLMAGRRFDRALKALSVVFAGLILVTLAVDVPGITLSVMSPAIKPIQFGGHTVITYYESEIGVINQVGMVLTWATYAYAFRGLYRLYRRNRSGHLAVILASLVAFVAGLVHDGLIASRVYSFVYLSEYTFLLVIAAMAYALLGRFVDLHLAVAELNRSLEQRVQEAVAQVKVLTGLIPICAACKKVRNDQGYWSQIETYVSQRSDATFTHGMCPDCMDQYYPNRRRRAEPSG
jgi:N-terminal 7TM region of histidine kinase